MPAPLHWGHRLGCLRLGYATQGEFQVSFWDPTEKFRAGNLRRYARHDAADSDRAQTSIDALLRLIAEGGHADSPVTVSVSYDDLDLAIKLSYKGTLPYVASEQRLPGGMVEEQIFAVGLSGYLSSVFPDRLNSQQKDGACEISLYFQT